MRKFSHHKKFEKAERAIDGDEDDIVLCSLTKENNEENTKKKVWLMEDVKQPLEAGMMGTIDGDTFFLFMQNTWIGDSDASSHITKDNTGLYDITDIKDSIQGSFSIMPTMKKGKL